MDSLSLYLLMLLGFGVGLYIIASIDYNRRKKHPNASV